jgi:hypothetical protein
MRVVIVGPSQGLVAAFEDRGVEVDRVAGVAVQDELEAAGVGDTDTIVFTDVREASAVPVARTINPDVRVVFYTDDAVPEFVTPSVDLTVDPDLLDLETVVDELTRT